jgi:8-oxo-dGTP pyrophosphatase MutT (NUDIX family)
MESISGVNDDRDDFARRVRAALALDVSYTDRYPHSSVKVPAAVILVFARSEAGMSLLLTRRTDSVAQHTGQMAFPGGRCESGEEFLDTAFRETEEEVGIARTGLEILGKLPRIDVPTGFVIEPYVAVHLKSADQIPLQVSEAEIAETLWVPWSVLLAPETYRKEVVSRGNLEFSTHVFYVGGHRVWGATAAMIKNLFDRWHVVSR